MGSSINSRINLLITRINKNPNSFSVEIKQKPQTTDKIIKGKNKPGYDYINSILSTYSYINPDWLIMGVGEMVRNIESIEKNTIEKHKVLGKEKQKGVDGYEANIRLFEQYIESLKNEISDLRRWLQEKDKIISLYEKTHNLTFVRKLS